MKFHEDPRAWKRVAWGALWLALSPVMLPFALLILLLYKIGQSFEEHFDAE